MVPAYSRRTQEAEGERVTVWGQARLWREFKDSLRLHSKLRTQKKKKKMSWEYWVVQTHYVHTWEAKVGELCQPGLHNELEARLGYTVRPCLETKWQWRLWAGVGVEGR